MAEIGIGIVGGGYMGKAHAVAMTAVTGGFAVLTVVGAVLNASNRREPEAAVSVSPLGLQGRF